MTRRHYLRGVRVGLGLVGLFLAVASFKGCASGFVRQLTHKTPQGYGFEQKLDLNTINFNEIASGQSVNVQEYMEAHARDFLLLTFGANGCGACRHKARDLTEQVIAKHRLFATPNGQHFEIIGVNTDSQERDRLAMHAQFPFIRWSDPAGLTMVRNFLPLGSNFGVPVTVLLSRDGVMWRVLPAEGLSVAAIMAKVEGSLGEDAGSQDGGGDDDGGGDGGNPVIVTSTPLTSTTPTRLNGVALANCAGEELKLGSQLGATPLRLLQVVKGPCDLTCKNNLSLLQSTMNRCEETAASGVPPRCKVFSLHTDGIDADLCSAAAAPLVYRGGAEFFTTFASFFNWSYPPIIDLNTYTTSLPPVSGPLTMAFDQQGRIVFSREGALTAADLEHLTRRDRVLATVPGPNFKLFDRERGRFHFADVRATTKFTVLAAWGAYPLPCSSCVAELQHWSARGELVDFCAAHPNECQVLALETHLPESLSSESLMQFYDGLIDGDGEDFVGMKALGIRVPLVLDPEPLYGDRGDEYLRRVFDGYLVASYPEWGSEYRTVIYDREGKIVAAFRAEEPVPGQAEPVLATLRKLLK